jgi:hypothetical protein
VQVRTFITEVARDHRDEAKVEAFEISKFFQVWEERAPKLGRSNNCHWIQPERSGPLRRFHVQEAVQQRSAQEKGYGPSDLGPITRQPLDLTGVA